MDQLRFVSHCKMLLLSCLIGLLCKCSSMSSLQTARVTKKGDVGFAIGYGNVLNDEGEEPFSRIHYSELNIRYGLAKRCDIGIEIGFPAPISFDIKYQLIGNDRSFMACGAGLGLTVFSFSEMNFGVILPLYLSIHPLEMISIYTSPRYLSFFGVGITSGVRLGKDLAVLAEYSIYKNFDNDAECVSQLTGAISYKIP